MQSCLAISCCTLRTRATAALKCSDSDLFNEEKLDNQFRSHGAKPMAMDARAACLYSKATRWRRSSRLCSLLLDHAGLVDPAGSNIADGHLHLVQGAAA